MSSSRRRPADAGKRSAIGPLVGVVVGEFEAMLRLTTATRHLLEAEIGKVSDGDVKLDEKQHVVWMLVKLGDLVTRLMREARQLQRQYEREVDGMSDENALQVLIDAGWKPPKGWGQPR
jgi:hypothetical protein